MTKKPNQTTFLAGALAQVVEHLQSISLNRTDLDTKGVAFEEFMGGFFKADFETELLGGR